MQGFNLNKLIIGFLTLAIIASTSAFLFSSGSRSGSPDSTAREAAGKGEAARAPKNAFVESLPPPEENKTPAGNDGNLTEVLAQRFAQKLLEANPAGPETIDGELGVNAPNPDEVMETFLENPGVYAALFTQEARLLTKRTDPKKVRVLQSPSQEDILAYLNGLNVIIDGELLADAIRKTPEQDPSPEALNLLDTTFQSALAKLDKLPVPRPLLGLHVSVRDTLIGASAVFNAGAENGGDDPMLSLLALQRETEDLQKSINRMQEEAAKLPDKVSGIVPRENLSWWQSLLVKRALALIPGVPTTVFDIGNSALHTTTSISSWGQLLGFIKEWVNDYLLETIKTHLVRRITESALSWIKGNGQPRFITNWRSFLDRTVNVAVGDVIYKLAPQLCSSFGPLVRIALTPAPYPLAGPVQCTLDQVVANFRNFYNDFNNGGWIAYTTALQPQNNFLGALIITSDIAAAEAAKKKEAAQNEALAAQGYIGQQTCSKWEWRTENPTSTNPDGTPLLPSKQLYCLEYKTTTPGATVGQTINAALLAPISRIVNAQTLTALTTMLIDSALNKLLTARKNSRGEETGLLGLEQGASASAFQLCDGFSDRAYNQCIKQARKSCEQMPPELKQACLEGITPPDEDSGGGGVCSDPGDSVANYTGDLRAAIDDVISRNPNGIADAPNTTENSLEFLNEVAASLEAVGFNATTNVKNGHDNPNSGDLIAVWRSGDFVVERYDAVRDSGLGNLPMKNAAVVQFTGDIPLSCASE